MAAGLQKTQVEQALGITRRTVANHESNETKPAPEMLARYAELYRTTVLAIKTGTARDATGLNTAAILAALSNVEGAIGTLRILLEQGLSTQRTAFLDEDEEDRQAEAARTADAG